MDARENEGPGDTLDKLNPQDLSGPIAAMQVMAYTIADIMLRSYQGHESCTIEWMRLLEHYPELYEQARAYEAMSVVNGAVGRIRI